MLNMRIVMGLLVTAGAVATATPLSTRSNHALYPRNSSMVYSFADVPISPDLHWTPCYENFTCANLEVPFDYADSAVGTTNIAFMKLPAAQQPAKGDILINLGGPANSGTSPVGLLTLVPLLGTSWNLVGMDPRGVNNSGPSVDCFPDTYARDYFFRNEWAPRLDASDPQSRERYWRVAGAFGDWCSKTLNDTIRYVNTPATARDMLQYAEKLAESKGKSVEEAKVNFYGLSYGSVLGSTFARLYPTRLGRFMMDGIVDNEDYYSGAWLTPILQADQAIQSFFEYCSEAGSSCKFNRDDTSAVNMQQRFDAILADLEQNPIAVSDPAVVQYPVIVDHLSVRSVVVERLTKFTTGFLSLDAMLTELENRNATLVIGLAGMGLVPAESTHISDHDPFQARIPITCNDMRKQYNISSPENFGEYVQKQLNVSRYFGYAFSSLVTVNCWNWPYDVPDSQIFHGFEQTETNNPVLWLANKIDAFSSSQEKMASFFPGSRILTQDAVGVSCKLTLKNSPLIEMQHGMTMASSTCTSSHVQAFLETGQLPPEGIICPVDTGPFDQVE